MKEARVYKNLRELSRQCALFIFDEIRKTINRTGEADVVLTGGNTPEYCYKKLAALLNREHSLVNSINWFLGDERWVSSDSRESNTRLIRTSLLKVIGAPEEKIFTWLTIIKDQFKCANDYNTLIQNHFIERGKVPDILLLGMGDDGHTASLFPGGRVLLDAGEFSQVSPDMMHNALPVYVNAMNTWRLTLTPYFINKAKLIVFLISGKKKRESFQKLMRGDTSLPVSWINGERVIYFITKDLVPDTDLNKPGLWPVYITLQK